MSPTTETLASKKDVQASAQSQFRIVADCHQFVREGGGIGKDLTYTAPFETSGWLRVQYVPKATHDKNVNLTLLVDRLEIYKTGWVGPNHGAASVVDVAFFVEPGRHKLTLDPECEVPLDSWGGTMMIQVSAPNT